MQFMEQFMQLIMINLPYLGLLSGAGVFTFMGYNFKKNKNIRTTNKVKYSLVKKLLEDNNVLFPGRMAYFLKDDVSKIDDNQIQKLKNIIKIFEKYIEDNNLHTCFEKNYKTLIFEKKAFYESIKRHGILSFITGYYESGINKISIYYDNLSTMTHEFLHMVSRKDIDKVGFHSIFSFELDNCVKTGDIGRGLNEGYTEVLNSRIFGYPLNEGRYKNNIKIALMIELLFDSPKEMEQAYFNADIDFLYDKISKYCTKNEFIDILEQMDNMSQILFSAKNSVDAKALQNKMLDIIERTGDKEKIEKGLDFVSDRTFTLKKSKKKIYHKRNK